MVAKSKKGTPTQTKKVVKPIAKKVVKPAPKENLNGANKKVLMQKVIVNRELKYIYPRGCKDTLARKSFRQKVRNALRKLERDINKLKGQDRINMKEKLAQYQATVLA